MIPRIGSNWKTRPLAELCEIVMGQAPNGESYNKKGIGLPLIAGAADLGAINPSPQKFTSEPIKKGMTGDIILCVRATIGDLNWADGKYCYGRGVCAIRPQNVLEPEFVWHWLSACRDHLISLGRGATFKQISKTDIANIPVPILSIEKQRRIVARIKECMERVEEIEKLRQNIRQEYDHLLESLIEAEFHTAEGKNARLGDICSISSSLVDPRKKEYKDCLHVGGANIEPKTGKLFNVMTVHDEKLTSGKFVFDQSMVLYNKIRPYLMKVARPDFKGLCSADMYPLSPVQDRLTRDYLFYLLLSRRFTDYAVEGSNRAGMPKVNRNYLFNFAFPLPSLRVQQCVTCTLDRALLSIDEFRENMHSAISESKALRYSILRKAFAGEL